MVDEDTNVLKLPYHFMSEIRDFFDTDKDSFKRLCTEAAFWLADSTDHSPYTQERIDKFLKADQQEGASRLERLVRDLGQKSCTLKDLMGILEDGEFVYLVDTLKGHLARSAERRSSAGDLNRSKSKQPAYSLLRRSSEGASTSEARRRRTTSAHVAGPSHLSGPEKVPERRQGGSVGRQEEEPGESSPTSGSDVDESAFHDCSSTSPGRQKRPPDTSNVASSGKRSKTSTKDSQDFSSAGFMRKYEDNLLYDVAGKDIALKLQVKDVLPASIAHKIKDTDRHTANLKLFVHFQQNGTRESILTLCEVMHSSAGYPKMQQLASRMKNDPELTQPKTD